MHINNLTEEFTQATRRYDLLIGGRHVPPASGRYFVTANPATEEVIAEVAEADVTDVHAAVRSRAQPSRARGGGCAGLIAAGCC